eukprot:CAMPEP_0177652826 /NCGR_PEP_ID=MMETSP0447-20121125/13363_1 /TAXON_ID=0 /ORGANISM="Stygamoeba regulata, Strain BSH-02190019" /LENGTH=643 /DNA_ID=CAMNT_0019156149 /DNA_START=162 /DNA_END=2094 /DNA_ORIENTATION=-
MDEDENPSILIVRDEIDEGLSPEKRMATRSFLDRDYASALLFYTAALLKNEKDYAALCNRSACNCLATPHNYRQALIDASSALALRPNLAQAHYNAGMAYFGLELFQKSFEAFAAAVVAAPHCAQYSARMQEAVKLVGIDPYIARFNADNDDLVEACSAHPALSKFLESKHFVAYLSRHAHMCERLLKDYRINLLVACLPALHPPEATPVSSAVHFCEVQAVKHPLGRKGHRALIANVSPCGTLMACASPAGDLRVFVLDPAQPVAAAGRPVRTNKLALNLSTGKEVSAVAVSHDAHVVAVGLAGGDVEVYALHPGSAHHTPTKRLRGHARRVVCLTFFRTDAGPRLVSGAKDSTLKVWEVGGQWRKWRTLVGHKDWVWACCAPPSGSFLLSGSTDRTAIIWETTRRFKIRCHLTGHSEWVRCVTATERVAVTGSDDFTLRLWDPVDGHCLRVLTGHGTRVWSAVLRLDSAVLLTLGETADVFVWELHVDTERSRLRVPPTEPARCADSREKHWAALAAPLSGQFAVLSGDRSSSLAVWADTAMPEAYAIAVSVLILWTRGRRVFENPQADVEAGAALWGRLPLELVEMVLLHATGRRSPWMLMTCALSAFGGRPSGSSSLARVSADDRGGNEDVVAARSTSP